MANLQYYDVILKPVVTEKKHELHGREEVHLPCSSGGKQDHDQGSRGEDVRRRKGRQGQHHELDGKNKKTRHGDIGKDSQDQESDRHPHRGQQGHRDLRRTLIE